MSHHSHPEWFQPCFLECELVVIPERWHENQTRVEHPTTFEKPILVLEVIGITERHPPRVAELISDEVYCVHSLDVDLRVFDDFALLDIHPLDLMTEKADERSEDNELCFAS
jgi:hypothetical protein